MVHGSEKLGMRNGGSGFAAIIKGERCPKAVFSLLPLEGGGAQRRRLARSFSLGQPLSRLARNGVSLNFSVALLLKIQFACTCPSGIPLPKEGDRWLTRKEPNP